MRIVINQARLEEVVTVGELLEMQSGNLPIIVSVMSKFVVDEEGQYFTAEQGEEIVKSLTIAELKKAASDFSKKVVDTAVPPQSGEDSETH